MKKGAAVMLSVAGLSALLLSGCATTGKKAVQENDDLKIQMQNLQTQIQQKDSEIASLRKALGDITEEKYAAAKQVKSQTRDSSVEHPKMKDVQVALKNAGFDPGTADGKMGKKTRQAIKEFQKANGLDADGKVGKKTWSVLAPYLDRTPNK